MENRHLFTPRIKGGERLKMFISNQDFAKIGRGMPWAAEVTDIDTGKRFKARGASCGSPGCFCDAVVRPL
jgi:hypothetical protein